MNKYKVNFSTDAIADLDGMYQYLFGQMLTPKTVSRIVSAVEDEINYYLSYMPFYPLVDDTRLAQKGVRKMVVKKYLVFFVVNEIENTVNIIHIIHGARQWLNVLK
jgi:plasmid stabilization system protein ParE